MKKERKNRNFVTFSCFSSEKTGSHILESYVFKKVHHEKKHSSAMFLLLHPQTMIMAHQVIPIQFHAGKF